MVAVVECWRDGGSGGRDGGRDGGRGHLRVTYVAKPLVTRVDRQVMLL